MSEDSILITGGAGFIGSHCALVLLEHGFNVIVMDNGSNSQISMLIIQIFDNVTTKIISKKYQIHFLVRNQKLKSLLLSSKVKRLTII